MGFRVASEAPVETQWRACAKLSLSPSSVDTHTAQRNALIRIGPAGAPKADGMAPGAALKVFRDNEESVNSFMLYSLRGQKPVLQGFEVIIGLLRLWCAAGFLQVECAVRKGFSQFEHMLCNKLSDFRDKGFAEKLLLKSFETASKYPFTTGLSQWAEGPGLLPEHTKFPFVLCLRPTDIIREHFEEFKHEKFEHIQEQLGFLCLGLTMPSFFPVSASHGSRSYRTQY